MKLLLLLSLVSVSVLGQAPVCNLPGMCIGHFISTSIVLSPNECLKTCQDSATCQWYSFLPDTRDCLLLEDCLAVDNTCTNCNSGERNCPITDFYTKLLVVSGFGSNNATEVLDLSERNQTCPMLADYPFTYGASGVFIEDRALVCGGGNGDAEKTCFEYLGGTWQEAQHSLTSERAKAAGTMLAPDKWWITGGNFFFNHWETTEVYTPELGFAPYVDLPESKEDHNLVRVNGTHFVLLGGTDSTKAWMFNSVWGNWTALPDTRETRDGSFAGLVLRPDGHDEVVVTAGVNQKTTEIYSLEKNTWRYGPDLPVEKELFQGSSVQLEDTFLVVGGFMNGPGGQDIIYRFDPVSNTWEMFPRRLSTAKYLSASFLVPDDYVQCV